MRTWGLFAAALLAVPACADDQAAGNALIGPEQLCQRWADAVGEAADNCDDDGQVYVDSTLRECEALLSPAVVQGAVLPGESASASCFEGISELRPADRFSDRLNSICRDASVGALGAGDPCYDSIECGNG